MNKVYLIKFHFCKLFKKNLILLYCTLQIIGCVSLFRLVLQFLSKWKAHRRCVSLPDAMPRRPRLLPPPLPPPAPAPRPRRPRTWHSLPSLLDPTQQHNKLRYDLTISSSHPVRFKIYKTILWKVYNISTTIIYYLSPSWVRYPLFLLKFYSINYSKVLSFGLLMFRLVGLLY